MRSRTIVVALGLLAALACSPATATAAAHSGGWNGSVDGLNDPLHFSVGHGAITKFTVPIILCTSAAGPTSEQFYVPRAAIHGSNFDGKYHPVKGSTMEIRGRFTSSHTLAGVIHEVYPCNTGDVSFHANLGPFKAPKSPAVPACSPTGCLAPDGMFIKVQAVDRTVKSVDPPPRPDGGIAGSADPVMANGGVGITVTITNRSGKDPTYVDPFVDFQLRLGSGVLAPAEDPGDTAVSGNGAKYTCTNPNVAQQLTRSGSFGPTSVCFGAPTPASRQHLTLYYMPDGSKVLAKIPLG